MLSPEAFQEQWGESGANLVRFPVLDDSIPDDARVFLRRAGLPDAAPPFLSFGARHTGPASDFADLGLDLSRFHPLGNSGNGDPIVIEYGSGHILEFEHDSECAEPVFMNSSPMQLAASLLVYRHLVRVTIERNGADAFLASDFPEDALAAAAAAVREIDTLAMEPGAFWADELIPAA